MPTSSSVASETTFRLGGPFDDSGASGTTPTLPVTTAADVGAFRTPSLRNLSLGAPDRPGVPEFFQALVDEDEKPDEP